MSETVNRYQELIKKAWNSSRPTAALFELTYRCNHLCTFCNNPIDRFQPGQPRPVAQREMTTEEIFLALRKLRDLNVLFLTLSGGEPLVHRDFFPIAEEAGRLGFAVRVFSNGYLIDRPMAQRIRALNPIEVSISIHGADAPTHEALTRIPGSFDKTVNAVRILKELGMNVMLKTPITKLNCWQMLDIYRLASGLGAHFIFDPVITPRFDGVQDPLALSPPDEFWRAFWGPEYNELRKGKLTEPHPFEDGTEASCGTGRNSLMIDPYGNIFPCSLWYRNLGNIVRDDLTDLWVNSPVLHEIRKTTKKIKSEIVPSQENGEFVHWCAAIAEQMTGDPTKPYPQAMTHARFQAEAWKEANQGSALKVIQ